MKKNVLFYGVLVAFMFLIAINTNVLGFFDMSCGDFEDCYWDNEYPRNCQCLEIERGETLQCDSNCIPYGDCNMNQCVYCCEEDPYCYWWIDK